MVVLHGLSAVAELKLGQLVPGQAVAHVLHGLSAVAELKPAGARRRPTPPAAVLHGLSAVAELKLAVQLPQPGVDRFSTASAPWPN